MSRIITFGLMGLLVFAPLPYGSVHPWAYSLVEIFVFSLCLLWLLQIFISKRDFSYRPTPLDLPLLLFFLLCLFQLVPLPPGLAKAISPVAHARYESVLLDSSSTPGPLSGWHPLSLYPFATGRALLKLFAYVGVFYLIVYHLETFRQLRRLLYAFLLLGSFQALYGLYHHFSARPILTLGRASGTFVNANHYAGYLEILIPLCLALLLILFPPSSPGLSLKERIIALAHSKRSTLLGLILLGLIIMIVATIFSISRAGIMSLAASLLFFCLGSIYLRRGRRWTFTVLLLVSLALLVGLWEGLGPVEQRFLKAPDSFWGRYQIWPSVWALIQDYPLLGSGLGTFSSAFLGYQREFPSSYFDHAHNDYLEILAETGGIGFLLLSSIFLIFFLGSLARLPRVKVREGQILALGGLSALFGLLLHSLFDFNLAIPSNVLTLCAAVGITHRALDLPGDRP